MWWGLFDRCRFKLFFLFSSSLVSYPARVRRPDKNKNKIGRGLMHPVLFRGRCWCWCCCLFDIILMTIITTDGWNKWLLLLLDRIVFERYRCVRLSNAMDAFVCRMLQMRLILFSCNIYRIFERYVLLFFYFWNTMDITNNNNNTNAGWGLMHTEGLYNDEDRSTDEGVLIRIKLKLLWLLLSFGWW